MDRSHVVQFGATGNTLDQETAQGVLVYACYGYAMYGANVVETNLIHVRATERVILARTEGRQIKDPWEKHKSDTMKDLIKEIAPLTVADPNPEADLARVTERRNYLAHQSWLDRTEELFSPSGRNDMLADLEQDIHLFSDVNARLDDVVVMPQLPRAGCTHEEFVAEYNRLHRQALLHT
ncbi:hypothetical protein ACWD26_16665 [Streptomyces sp. NPDC002787]